MLTQRGAKPSFPIFLQYKKKIGGPWPIWLRGKYATDYLSIICHCCHELNNNCNVVRQGAATAGPGMPTMIPVIKRSAMTDSKYGVPVYHQPAALAYQQMALAALQLQPPAYVPYTCESFLIFQIISEISNTTQNILAHKTLLIIASAFETVCFDWRLTTCMEIVNNNNNITTCELRLIVDVACWECVRLVGTMYSQLEWHLAKSAWWHLKVWVSLDSEWCYITKCDVTGWWVVWHHKVWCHWMVSSVTSQSVMSLDGEDTPGQALEKVMFQSPFASRESRNGWKMTFFAVYSKNLTTNENDSDFAFPVFHTYWWGRRFATFDGIRAAR